MPDKEQVKCRKRSFSGLGSPKSRARNHGLSSAFVPHDLSVPVPPSAALWPAPKGKGTLAGRGGRVYLFKGLYHIQSLVAS